MKKRAARRAPRRRTPTSDRTGMVRRLREIRRLARGLRAEATTPLVERIGQIIETECHLALWALGEIRDMIPEVERG